MFKSKTLFIVGAGASQEVGLPTNAQLKAMIAEKLDIDPFGKLGRAVAGDTEIARAISEYAQRNNMDTNILVRDAWKIRDAMPQAISIDNFVNTHGTTPGIVICGKLGIAQAIIEAERNSKLIVGSKLIVYDQPGQFDKIDYTEIGGTWYAPFFQLLTENVRNEEVVSLFDNISIITFNYDRCIEHFLYHAIQNYFAFNDIARLMQKLRIFHPYGVVGPLPWQDLRSVSFGGVGRNRNWIDIANDIRTFTERVEGNDPALASIRQQVQEAETIVFLGFGYHALNMELLSLEQRHGGRRVFGTAKGISDADVKTIIIPETARMLRISTHHSIHINNKLTCCELFGEYWHILSRA
jgi:hypothetical protein